jgi:hypothetical protein
MEARDQDRESQIVGTLGYHPHLGNECDLGLLAIDTGLMNKGIARALLRGFAERVGPETTVTAQIIHKGSLMYLESVDSNPTRECIEVVEIQDPSELSKIPISRVLTSGAITPLGVEVTFNPVGEEDKIKRVTLKGITK